MARYTSNAERGAANLVALVLSYRQKHKQIDASIENLAKQLDEKLIQLKQEILGGAASSFDTLGELQQIIERNQEGIRVLEELSAGHVRFDRIQSLTAAEKEKARENIGAVSIEELEDAFGNVIPFTPTVSVSKTGNVTTVTTQDAKGTTTAQIKDGERGPHYTPIVDDDGNLSWTNDAGLANPVSKNIKGPRGLQGVQGVPGVQGEKGDPGAGLIIHGEYDTYEALVSAHPVGEEGDAYLVDGDVWYWAAENNQWKNGGPLRGPQGIQGERGFHFTPFVNSSGVISWTNNGGLTNPSEVNVRGPRGFTFTPSVNSSGDISWSNDGGLSNPATKNIRGPIGYTYTPSMTFDGILSWTNNGGLSNPSAVNLTGPRGYHFTPSVADNGDLSWSNDGNLANPATKNIRGPVGYYFTPSIDDNGNVSWTNNGGLANPATKNVRGPQGFTFTPSMSQDGTLSWTNNGGLPNPETKNLIGPRGFSVRDALLTEEFTAEQFWMYTDSSLTLWWKVSNASDFVVGDVACIHKALDIEGYGHSYQITCFGVVTDTRSEEIRVSIFARVRDGVHGEPGKDGKAFTYDDFLPHQLEELKGPKGDTGPGMKSINVGSKNSSFFSVEAGKHVMIGVEEQPVVLYPGDMLCAYGTMADQEDNFAILFGEVSTYTFDNAGNWQIGLYVRGHFYALRGKQGPAGSAGPTGPRGYHFTPSVSSAGVLSWTNDGGLSNPSSVNIKGPKGDPGKDGVDGVDGSSGKDGIDGKNGVTFTPAISSTGVVSWTNDGGLKNPDPVSVRGPMGLRGQKGEKGEPFEFSDFTDEQIESLKVKGDRGPKGDPGNALLILGVYDSLSALQSAHPIGVAGDAYHVTDTHENYVWDGETNSWRSIGEFVALSANDFLMSTDPAEYFRQIYGESSGDIIGDLLLSPGPVTPDPSETFETVLNT